MLETPAQTHGFQSLLSSRQRFTLRQTADEKRHSRIFQSGKLRQQVVKLINEPEGAVAQTIELTLFERGEVLAGNGHSSGIQTVKTAQYMQER